MADTERQEVVRLTIDEKLSEDLIRVLIARLKKQPESIISESERWEDEEELLLNKKNYPIQLKEFGLSEEQAKAFIWDDPKEGQVCHLGEPEEEGREVWDRKAADSYFEAEQIRSKRIERASKYSREVRDSVKDLYLEALKRSVQHGNRNRNRTR